MRAPVRYRTGGLGFVATSATIERAGITLRHDQAVAGAGAGGTAQAVPFVLDRLALGDAAATNLPGVYFPETDLERDLGHRGTGLSGQE